MRVVRWRQFRSFLNGVLRRGGPPRPGRAESPAASSAPAPAAHHVAADYLDDLARRVVGPLLTDSPPDLRGRRIGAYRLVREIGRGGMGAVFLAERADGQFHKRVALKLLPLGMNTPDRRRRFLAEREILARLEHPGIARLLDGGIMEDGTPYLVMDHVRGVPLDVYCEERRLPLDARLELFLHVCNAVDYAHRSLIVHRDLKPSNILVAEDGAVKLLDFGIAKVLEAGRAEAGPATSGRAAPRPTTAGDGWRLTPEYASPEQVRGEPVTVASDVYALGLVLYQLLTGTNPQRHAGRSVRTLEEVVCEREPEPPSAAVSRTAADAATPAAPGSVREAASGPGRDRASGPVRHGRGRPGARARLRRKLAGDLDTIVLTALRKDPARRYASVARLAEDIRRYRAGRPISARPDTLRYRAAKFVRRHAIGVASGAAIAALLVLLTVLSVRFAVDTAAQSRQIALERDRVERVSTFLYGMLEELSPHALAQDLTSARETLDRSAAIATLHLGGQPAVQASLLEKIGALYMDWGLLAEAEPLLRRSLALREELFGPSHPDVAAGLHALGEWHWRMGRHDRSEEYFRRALALRSSLLEAGHPDLASTLNDYAVLLHDRGRHDEAEAFYREALRSRRDAFGPDHPRTVNSLNGLAAVLRDRGEYDAAAALFDTVIDRRRRLYGERHPAVATALHNLGLLHVRTGDHEAAAAAHREALAIREDWFGTDHHLVGNSLHNLAKLMLRMRAFDRAEAHYRRALAIFRDRLPPDHPRAAAMLVGLGTVRLFRGDADGAASLLRRGLAARERAYGPDHWLVADTKVTLGGSLTALGRFAEAEELLRAGHAALRSRFGDDDVRTRAARRRLAHLYEVRDPAGAGR